MNKTMIPLLPDTFYICFRQDFALLCQKCEKRKDKSRSSPYCKALILSILDHWTFDNQQKGKSLSIHITHSQWEQLMYGLFGRNVIIDSLEELTMEKWIKRESFKPISGGREQYRYTLQYKRLSQVMSTLKIQTCQKEQGGKINVDSGIFNDQGVNFNHATLKNQPSSAGATLNFPPLIEDIDSNIDTEQEDERREVPPPSPGDSPSIHSASSDLNLVSSLNSQKEGEVPSFPSSHTSPVQPVMAALYSHRFNTNHTTDSTTLPANCKPTTGQLQISDLSSIDVSQLSDSYRSTSVGTVRNEQAKQSITIGDTSCREALSSPVNPKASQSSQAAPQAASQDTLSTGRNVGYTEQDAGSSHCQSSSLSPNGPVSPQAQQSSYSRVQPPQDSLHHASSPNDIVPDATNTVEVAQEDNPQSGGYKNGSIHDENTSIDASRIVVIPCGNNHPDESPEPDDCRQNGGISVADREHLGDTDSAKVGTDGAIVVPGQDETQDNDAVLTGQSVMPTETISSTIGNVQAHESMTESVDGLKTPNLQGFLNETTPTEGKEEKRATQKRTPKIAKKRDLLAESSPEAQLVVQEWLDIFKRPIAITTTLIEHAETIGAFKPEVGRVAACRKWMYATDRKKWYSTHGMHLGDVAREFERFLSLGDIPELDDTLKKKKIDRPEFSQQSLEQEFYKTQEPLNTPEKERVYAL